MCMRLWGEPEFQQGESLDWDVPLDHHRFSSLASVAKPETRSQDLNCVINRYRRHALLRLINNDLNRVLSGYTVT
jgi:hypothetical protein